VALKSGDVQAVVYDAPVLQYEAAKLNDEKLQMVGPVFERQNYAFALQQDSALRERLNQGLLDLTEQRRRQRTAEEILRRGSVSG
jgi:polar amino acid transport system substrate-binding protein